MAKVIWVACTPDGGNAPEGTPPESPHAVLRRRLASGALTPQQYEEHKALLDRDN